MDKAGRKDDPRTVFVRNVPYDVDDEALNSFFSELGPVKQAFLVKKAGSGGRHQGFGFVQFAVQEDAERAVAELHCKLLGGRKLQVEGAIKRAPMEERKKKRKQAAAAAGGEGGQAGDDAAAAAPSAAAQAEAAAPPAKKPRLAKPAKPAPAATSGGRAGAEDPRHRLVRAVAVACPSPETLDAAVAKARAAGEVEELVRPVPADVVSRFKLERDGCTPHSFLVFYKTVKHAMAAVETLHCQPAAAATPADGSSGAGGKKQRRSKGTAGAGAAAAAGGLLWARQVSGEGMHLKRWRLIVRNLPFSATEADLHTAFDPAGFVWELTLPRTPEGKLRGFAFVGFTCKADAERGIRLVNGQPVAKRPVAVDWAVSKAQYDAAAGSAAAQEAKHQAAKGGQQQQGIEAGSDSEEELEGQGRRRRAGHESDDDEGAPELAPDRERSMLQGVIAGILEESEDEEPGGSQGEQGEGEEEGEEGAVEGAESEGDDEESEGEEAGSSSSAEEEEEPEAGAAGDIFSRQALTQRQGAQAAAVERLQRLEKAAGAAVSGGAGKQQQEPAAGATVFVRGLPLDATKDQLFEKMKAFGRVRSCRLVMDKASGKPKGTAFVDFADAAAASRATEACAKGRAKAGPGVVVAGRVVEVDLALGQDDARSLAVQKAGERGAKQDKRHLGLAKEGEVQEGSAAWEDMSEGDRKKRKRAAEEKRLKLRSPNFVVSTTRLSVRNIPRAWTEAQLRTLFLAAVKERASKEHPRIRQAKILMEDAERAGPDAAPRSKGIGFVEFEEHSHALAALRQLNNNPKPWGKDRRPIVEFAIDNVKMLKAREAKLARSKQQQQQAQQQQQQGDTEPAAQPQPQQQRERRTDKQQSKQQHAEDGEAEGGARPGGQPLSKRQLRRQRRQMLKERAQQQRQQQKEQGGAAPGSDAGKGEGEGEGEDSPAKRRSQKRREQRKRHKAQAENGGVAGAVLAAAVTAPKQQQHKGQQQPQGKQQGKRQQQQQEQQAQKPRANSRAAKALAAAQQEQAVQQRKRQADALLDQLAGAVVSEGRLLKKKRRKQETDRLDRLEARHKQVHYGEGPAKKQKTAADTAAVQAVVAAGRAGLKRWFD